MPDESTTFHTKKPPPLAHISGVILAGGKSSRYGENKAFAQIRGIPIIERVAGVLKNLFRDLIIISNNPADYKYLGFPVFHDHIKGLGPLGGIMTALRTMTTPYGFVAACDMPFLSEKFIRHMVSITDTFDIVAPKLGWKIEALHALYSRRCLPHIEDLIQSGQYQVVRLFPTVSVRYVEEQEARMYDPKLKSLMNINSPEDMEKIRSVD
jgi:molybdopterin-guanine dinucleotide biosynthesis protein A